MCNSQKLKNRYESRFNDDQANMLIPHDSSKRLYKEYH